MLKQGKERGGVEEKDKEERTREAVTESARVFVGQKATQNGAGRATEEGRCMGERYYLDKKTESTEEAALIDETLTKELGAPAKALAAAEFEGREERVVLERSSYKRLPHSPVGPGIGVAEFVSD